MAIRCRNTLSCESARRDCGRGRHRETWRSHQTPNVLSRSTRLLAVTFGRYRLARNYFPLDDISSITMMPFSCQLMEVWLGASRHLQLAIFTTPQQAEKSRPSAFLANAKRGLRFRRTISYWLPRTRMAIPAFGT